MRYTYTLYVLCYNIGTKFSSAVWHMHDYYTIIQLRCNGLYTYTYSLQISAMNKIYQKWCQAGDR